MSNHGRPPRLPPEDYRGHRTVSITGVVGNRTPIFTDGTVVEAQLALLKQACLAFKCTCRIYCFMPDHAHIILRGLEADSDSRLAIAKFKAQSSSWLIRNGFPKWQEGFHDRIMRWQELRDHAKYVVLNPVRAGIVENFTDYPFVGSFEAPILEVLASISDSEEF